MKEILFLDIDGVLNNYHMRNFGEIFSKPCCEALNTLLKRRPDLKVVISSAWRTWGTAYMQDILLKNGVDASKDRVIDCTGKEQGERGYQIQCWLDRNPGVTNMVIIDDESDMGPLLTHLVKTNRYVGLTSADADKAIEVLSKPIN